MRAPDVIIGGAAAPYLMRWWLIPRNRFFNVYLHKFLRDDDDRALHDHPWVSCSILLRGGYIEHLPGGVKKVRRCFWPYFRRATQAHRIELLVVPTWTLFITGPKVREWGFLCPQGWRHWKIFVKPADTTEPGYQDAEGRGCE